MIIDLSWLQCTPLVSPGRSVSLFCQAAKVSGLEGVAAAAVGVVKQPFSLLWALCERDIYA